jgi:hypothetical protein
MSRFYLFFLMPMLLLGSDLIGVGTPDPGSRSNENRGNSIFSTDIILDKPVPIHELRPGDILVKANHNWLPGTSQVYGGKGFGHAAIVIRGARDTSLLRLLQKTVVFESHSRDVPPGYQLREAPAYLPGADFRHAAITFGPQNLGCCFRLRPSLTEKQIRQLLAFITASDNGVSCWRACKRFHQSSANDSIPLGDNWYCSLLIWQAFYTLFGLDLDPNAGLMVYPNDLIASPYFDNKPGAETGRVRF